MGFVLYSVVIAFPLGEARVGMCNRCANRMDKVYQADGVHFRAILPLRRAPLAGLLRN
jgi:hypothetical protein